MPDGNYRYSGDGKCRSCGDKIHWFKTPRGKNMPVDDDPKFEGAKEGQEFLGQTFVQTFTCHFETCAQADQHRG